MLDEWVDNGFTVLESRIVDFLEVNFLLWVTYWCLSRKWQLDFLYISGEGGKLTPQIDIADIMVANYNDREL